MICVLGNEFLNYQMQTPISYPWCGVLVLQGTHISVAASYPGCLPGAPASGLGMSSVYIRTEFYTFSSCTDNGNHSVLTL